MKLEIKIIGLYLASTIVVSAAVGCYVKAKQNDTCPDPVYANGLTCSYVSGSRPTVVGVPPNQGGQQSYTGDGLKWCEYNCGNDANGKPIIYYQYEGLKPDGPACSGGSVDQS
jgi:hypothetical protein